MQPHLQPASPPAGAHRGQQHNNADRLAAAAEEVEAGPQVSRRIFLVRFDRGVPDRPRVLIRSGCFGAGFDEGEPLVAEVSDYLQEAAEGFYVGGQGAQFGGARLGVLDG